MPNKLQHSWRSPVIFALFVGMMTALFFSRAALSVCMISFVILSFCHRDIKAQFSRFFSSPVLWGISLLFFLPLLSGLWSDDKEQWADILRVKLPLLCIPVAFAGLPVGFPADLSKRSWEWLACIFIVLVTAGTCWSMFHYVPDMAAVNESYLKAKAIVTPLENDHVRFSWLVSVAILLAGWFCAEKRKEEKRTAFLLGLTSLWLIIFLHLLAVRTGLFSFYIMAAGTIAWLIFQKANRRKGAWKYGLLLLPVLIALPLVAYKTIPSFHNRVQYFLYDRSYFKKAHYWPGSTDAVRVISLKAGWELMEKEPMTGTGFGDVLETTKQWYTTNYPEMTGSDKIYPSSEWLIYGVACGWPGFLLFSLVMSIPFYIKTRAKLLWWLLNATAAFSFLFDIGLEVQFGVFIYSFIILWWWKWLSMEKV